MSTIVPETPVTPTALAPATYEVAVDNLSLHHASGESLHYERDRDLTIHTKAAKRGGEFAAVVLVELGIDGYACHQARLDFGTLHPKEGEEMFHYERTGDEVRALNDAIETLTAIRDQLAEITGQRY